MGRIDPKIGVAAVHVIRAQRLEIALESLLRVTIVIAHERQQTARRRLEIVNELVIVEYRVADDIDLPNLSPLALLNLD